MNPLQAESTPHMQLPQTINTGGASSDAKKKMLQHLIQIAIGGPGKSIHDAVHGIKTALGAYKDFAKEVDGISGDSTDTAPAAPSASPMSPQQGALRQAMAAPSKSPMMPPSPLTMPPPPQGAQGMPPPPPQAQLLPSVLPPPPPSPDQGMISPPMPAFMGGGHPAGA